MKRTVTWVALVLAVGASYFGIGGFLSAKAAYIEIIPIPVEGYKCPDSCTGALCGGTPCHCSGDDCVTQ